MQVEMKNKDEMRRTTEIRFEGRDDDNDRFDLGISVAQGTISARQTPYLLFKYHLCHHV